MNDEGIITWTMSAPSKTYSISSLISVNSINFSSPSLLKSKPPFSRAESNLLIDSLRQYNRTSCPLSTISTAAVTAPLPEPTIAIFIFLPHFTKFLGLYYNKSL